jgi:cytidine deaminase
LKYVDFPKLSRNDQELLRSALKILGRGYAPYSLFTVAAAVRSETTGKIYTGCNVETATYAGICAEQAAVAEAVKAADYKLSTIGVVAKVRQYNVQKLSGPCGICRQVLYELSDASNNDIKYLMAGSTNGRVLVSSIRELLPESFGPSEIGVDVSQYTVSTRHRKKSSRRNP